MSHIDRDGSLCNFCERAPAVCGALRRPACGACAEAIATFYRGEKWSLKAIADEHRAKHG